MTTPLNNSASKKVLERLKKLHPKRIDLSLARIARLLERLDSPQDKLAPVVHVAGTNAKGSLIAFLRASLTAAGYGVQCYTSPHLVHFNERIRLVNGEITDDALADLLEECETANDGEAITFFEITSAAALLAFSRQKADVVLLETGLGGRLDATNMVARPLLGAITPISYDHQQFLGQTLAKIASEKAGIMKSGVVCVIAAQAREAAIELEKQAAKIATPLFVEGKDWRFYKKADTMIYESGNTIRSFPSPGLIGDHQLQNAAMAIACLDMLEGFTVPDDAIAKGLKNVRWPGRLQPLQHGPLPRMLPAGWQLWLDGGHNQAAAQALALQAKNWQDMPLHLIVGIMANKDIASFLKPLATLDGCLRTVGIPGEDGAMNANNIAKIAKKTGMKARPASSVDAAVADIIRVSPIPARVLICGSLYLAGAVLEKNDSNRMANKVISDL